MSHRQHHLPVIAATKLVLKDVGPRGTKTTEYCFAVKLETGGIQMADNKNNQDNRDRSQVSSRDDYEVQYLMTKFDLSKSRALELIIKHAGSRKKIELELSNS
jgi:hypothetical protein